MKNSYEWHACENPLEMVEYLMGISDPEVPSGALVTDNLAKKGVSMRRMCLLASALWRVHAGNDNTVEGLMADCEKAESWADTGTRPLVHGGGWLFTSNPALAAHNGLSRPHQGCLDAKIMRNIVEDPFSPCPKPWRQCRVCNGHGNVMGAVVDRVGTPCSYCNGRGIIRELSWITEEIYRLALATYHNKGDDGALDPVRLGILADCLKEAGQEDSTITRNLLPEACPVYGAAFSERWSRHHKFFEHRNDAVTYVREHPRQAYMPAITGPRTFRGNWALDALIGRE